MGVPKFYRWISERYPCLSEVIQENELPEFDNLYLDMNGIIHSCSHPNDDDITFRISQEQIFRDIFHYVERLFDIIKPRKVFFMAVDGVAPRAKMNQQRSRRFMSAKNAEDALKLAKSKGIEIPEEERFDSNCITPGTKFMAELHEQMQFFIQLKITQDPEWQNIRVYFSGHDCPGEGEHKIMDFIRSERSNTNYDANTRHCLYGLDADLIMLGIASHEPHFSLLREEVKFSRRKQCPQAKESNNIDGTTFHLLHLSLLREYLCWEFRPLEKSLKFQYQMESVIDDWVLMGFLVGNDFIPHLPNIHIHEDAFPLLYKTYIQILPELDGYMNENGTLVLHRFERFLKTLAKNDRQHFLEFLDDQAYLNSKRPQKPQPSDNIEIGNSREVASTDDAEGDDAENAAFDSDSSEEDIGTKSADGGAENSVKTGTDNEAIDKFVLPTPSESRFDSDPSDELLGDFGDEDFSNDCDAVWTSSISRAFKSHKRRYYYEKMKYENIKKRELRDQVEGYIRAIQWNLHYYYHGCCSWNWYYPHHYAPYVSDLRNFSELKIEFELSEPFHPFEQLLAVLPAASAGCLPVPFQHLMKDESSPIIDFYPEKFSTDLNGKKNDWEAVVLIPFIDENRLLTAMADCEPQLTDEERQRNSYGPHLLFTSGAEPSTLYSTFPTLFQDLNSNTAKREEVDMNTFRIPISKIVYGLLPGVKLDVFFPGFPTMKHIPHVAELRNANVRVFQQPTQKPSMILCVSRRTEFKDLDEVSSRLVGLEVHVEWPFLKHGLVHEIWTKERRYALDKETQELTVTELSAEDSSRFAEYVTITTAREFGRYGIDVVSKDAIALVRSSIGVHYCVENKEMTLKRQWSEPDAARPYSLDLIVQNVIENDSICSSAALNVEEAFPVNSTLFIISHSLSKYYGMKATIKQNNISSKGELIVSCCLPKANLDCQYLIEKCHPYTNRWFSLHQVSRHTLLPRHVIALLTSTVLICPTKRPIVLSHRPTNKVNIGLEIKSTKRNLAIPDFAKKGNGEYWQYSKRTLLVIEEYKRRFPEVLCYLEHSSRSDLCYADDIWPSLSPADSEKKISEIRQFLSELPISSTKMERADSVFLDSSVIKEIERQIDNHALQDNNRYQKLNVKPSAIFSPILQSGNCVPDIKADYRLYDRVVYVRKSSTVPLGLCGTIVGIIGPEEDRTFDVVFDKPFLGGKSIHGSKASGIRLKPSTLINISYGGRMRQPKTMLEGKTTNLKTKDSSNINSEVSVICQSSRSSAGRDTVFSQLFHVSEDNIDKVTQNVSETFGKPIVVMVGKGRIPVSSTGNKAEKHRIPGRMGTERAVQMGIQKKDCTTRSSLRTTATPFASDKRSEGEIKVNKSEGSVWQKLFPVSAEGFSDTSSSHEKCEQDTRSWTNSNQHDVVKTLLDSLSKFNLDNKSGEMNCKKKSPDTFLPPQRFSLVGASEKDKFQFPQVAVTWPPPRPPPLPINQSASHVLPFRPCYLMPHSFNTSKGQCSGIRAQNYDVSRNMVANSYFSSAPFPCRPQLHPSILRNTQTQPPLHSTQEFAHHLDRHELKTRPLSSARALRQIPPRMDRSHQGKQRWFGFARNGRGYLSNDGRQKCVRGAVDEQYIGIRTPSDMIPTQVIRKRNRSKRMVLTEKMNRDKPATSKESPFEKENTRKKEEERKKKEKEGKTVRDEEIEEEGCRQTEGCGYHEESRNQAKTETGSQPIHRKRRTRVAANL